MEPLMKVLLIRYLSGWMYWPFCKPYCIPNKTSCKEPYHDNRFVRFFRPCWINRTTGRVLNIFLSFWRCVLFFSTIMKLTSSLLCLVLNKICERLQYINISKFCNRTTCVHELIRKEGSKVKHFAREMHKIISSFISGSSGLIYG